MTLNSKSFKLFFVFGLWFLAGFLWWFWSYVMVDGNLILTSWQPYWHLQTWLWHEVLPNKNLLAFGYTLVILLLFLAWFFMLLSLKRLKPKTEKRLKTWQVVLIYLGLSLPFILAYNALSHDLFNYIFNAKMVLFYHANPHVKTALDFSYDPWTRFMHNVHTPAPYGYGWTGLSLAPYFLGLGKFSLTWLIFKLFEFLSLVVLFFLMRWWGRLLGFKLRLWHLASFFLNPLILVEMLSNAHNDIWMMNLFLVASGLLLSFIKDKPIKLKNFQLTKLFGLILSLFFFLLAGWIKLATFVTSVWYGLLFLASWFNLEKPKGIISGLLSIWLREKVRLLVKLTPLAFSLLLFLLLLSSRSRQFLPWYLSWSLVFLPLLLAASEKITLGVVRVDKKESLEWLPRVSLYFSFWLIGFSFSSLLRYLPWLYYAGYSDEIILKQKAITWLGGLGLFVILYLFRKKLTLKFLVND